MESDSGSKLGYRVARNPAPAADKISVEESPQLTVGMRATSAEHGPSAPARSP